MTEGITVYEIRSELVKADKHAIDKISEIKLNFSDSIDQTLNEMKNIESKVYETMNKIKVKVRDDNQRMSEKLDKISELSEVIDKRVKREKSDVEIEIRNTFGKIELNETKIKELTEYDNRIGNILVRVLEYLKLSAEWNIHEEELFIDKSTNKAIAQSTPSSPMRKGERLSPTNMTRILNNDLMKQLNLNNFPSIFGSSNRINKTIDQSIYYRENSILKSQCPVRVSFPPIEYNDLILTKQQVYKICESLVCDASKYLDNNIYDDKLSMIIEGANSEKIEFDEDLKTVFSLQKQIEAFNLALKFKENKSNKFKKLVKFEKKTDKNNHSNSKTSLRTESARKIHNKSVELKGVEIKEIPYENIKLIDKLQKSQLEILAPKAKNSIFKRPSISRSSIKSPQKFLPNLGKNQNVLQLDPLPSIPQ